MSSLWAFGYQPLDQSSLLTADGRSSNPVNGAVCRLLSDGAQGTWSTSTEVLGMDVEAYEVEIQRVVIQARGRCRPSGRGIENRIKVKPEAKAQWILY